MSNSKLLDDMNDLRSREITNLDVINSPRLWMIWAIMGCELKALDAMNSLGLWMIWMILGRELKALDAMNGLR